MHRGHFLCLIPVLAVLGWSLVGSGTTALAGVGLLALICPLTMAVVMWLLMRPPPAGDRDPRAATRHDELSGQR